MATLPHPTGSGPALTLAGVTVIQALGDGLTMMRMVDPDAVSPERYTDTLAHLLESAIALDRQRRGQSG